MTLVLDLINISQSQNGEGYHAGINHLKRTFVLHPDDKHRIPGRPPLDLGHDPRHSDVHGQTLCDAVQEGPGHYSTPQNATVGKTTTYRAAGVLVEQESHTFNIEP